MDAARLIAEARAALRGGRADAARTLARRRLDAAPDDVDALEVAAMAAAALGDAAAAERDFRRILAIDPAARWAREDLARLLLDQGRRDEAEAEVRTALAHDPDFADGHALLGLLFAEREALVEAGWHFEAAIARAGRHPDLLVNLGRTWLRRGELAGAARLAAEAAAAQPRALAPAVLAADVAEQAGDQAGAARWLDRAEPLARAQGSDVGLARARLLAGGADWPAALDRLDREPELSGTARLLRGRLRERAGRFAEAWDDFVGGKAALARRHDRAAIERDHAALVAAIRPGLPVAGVRRDGAQPIFILGAPRSGTTMAEQLLAAQPAIAAGGELPFVTEMAALLEKLAGLPLAAAIASLGAADRRHLPALLRDLYLARAERYGLAGPAGGFFTDKMPLNEVHLPLIRLAFPEAPLILVGRHPLDILVSTMSHDLTHGDNAFYDPADAACHLAATGRLVAHWRDALGIAPYRFGYEAFVADQPGETARLMAALGLDPDPAQAAFHRLARHAPTPSYAQVREPVHARAIGRWRRFAAQLAPYRPILAARIAAEGYAAQEAGA